ncbi:hypothetical protein JCM15765_30790 [Paradesulfitobacterium aromaticivorans]
MLITFYLSNEGISILENSAKMGVPFPEMWHMKTLRVFIIVNLKKREKTSLNKGLLQKFSGNFYIPTFPVKIAKYKLSPHHFERDAGIVLGLENNWTKFLGLLRHGLCLLLSYDK